MVGYPVRMPLLLLLPLVIFGTTKLVQSAWTGKFQRRFWIDTYDQSRTAYLFDLAFYAVGVGLGWYLLLSSFSVHIHS